MHRVINHLADVLREHKAVLTTEDGEEEPPLALGVAAEPKYHVPNYFSYF